MCNTVKYHCNSNSLCNKHAHHIFIPDTENINACRYLGTRQTVQKHVLYCKQFKCSLNIITFQHDQFQGYISLNVDKLRYMLYLRPYNRMWNEQLNHFFTVRNRTIYFYPCHGQSRNEKLRMHYVYHRSCKPLDAPCSFQPHKTLQSNTRHNLNWRVGWSVAQTYDFHCR
jgi:hypothetical protein